MIARASAYLIVAGATLAATLGAATAIYKTGEGAGRDAIRAEWAETAQQQQAALAERLAGLATEHETDRSARHALFIRLRRLADQAGGGDCHFLGTERLRILTAAAAGVDPAKSDDAVPAAGGAGD